ncbi:DUF6783 domain-containing protein [Otoolea muris]
MQMAGMIFQTRSSRHPCGRL